MRQGWSSGEKEVSNLPVHSLNDDASDLIRVGIGGGSSVLEIALTLLCALPRDSDRRATIGNTPSELVHAGSLVCTSHAELITFTVDFDMFD